VAPTDSLPVVRYDRKAEQRSPDLLRWSLIPYWAKDFKVGFANINAKAEGIETRRAFRQAFERRRCLVPVDNFYEWMRREVDICSRSATVGKKRERRLAAPAHRRILVP
jgi:putative SOS response-associated peptidase YedK